ncbi:MAG: phosphoribosyltransferase family protein [Pseudomonadota bacterium]|nr:phosphoribosyltransferase family protein [Pseudomonadota bacterium]
MIEISTFPGAVLDILFPRRCLICSVFLTHPLSGSARKQSLEKYLCPACRQHLQIYEAHLDKVRLFGVEKVFSGYLYAGSLEKIIPAWKYHNRHEFFPLVRALLNLSLPGQKISNLAFDLIMAIPLSPRALRKRGFNQAFFIASCTSMFLKQPLACNLLIKHIDTPQQASSNRQARALNLRPDVFQVSEPDRIAGKNILLCDDVLTTGATLSAAARVLKSAGAAKVSALTLARVVLD